MSPAADYAVVLLDEMGASPVQENAPEVLLTGPTLRIFACTHHKLHKSHWAEGNPERSDGD